MNATTTTEAADYDIETLTHSQIYQSTSTSASSVTSSADALHSHSVQIQFSLPTSVEQANSSSSSDAISRATSQSHTNEDTHVKNQQQQQNQEEEKSVTSLTSMPYFEPVDFKPAYWDNIIDHGPTLGFALFGFAMVITHPVFFMAGLVTALGTATAASRGYDYCIAPGNTDKNNNNTCDVPLEIIPCWVNNNNNNNTSDNETIWEQNVLDQQHQTPMQSPSSQSPQQSRVPSKESTNTATTDETQHTHDTRTHSQSLISQHALLNDTDEDDHLYTEDHHQQQQAAMQQWSRQHYPTLNNTLLSQQTFPGLNVQEFFTVFFGNDAPYNFQEFQIKRGDKNITYGPWEPIPTQHHTSQQQPISMHPDATTTENDPFSVEYNNSKQAATTTTTTTVPSLPVPPETFQTRTLRFQAKTNNGLLGPSYATTTKTQKWLQLSKRFAILESKTVLQHIPFCDKFMVLERWYLTATKQQQQQYYTTQLTVTADVYFVDSCPFEQTIRAKSTTAIHDVVHAWTTMALQALERTKQAKLQRLAAVHSSSSSAVVVVVTESSSKENHKECDTEEQEVNSVKRKTSWRRRWSLRSSNKTSTTRVEV